jgi:polyisoprenoid-binding protein YceI
LRRTLFALVCLAVSSLACSRSEPKRDRTEPWLATSLAPSASAAAQGAVEYTLGKSTIEFELPARRSTPRGRVRSARGQLSVDFSEPSRSRGSVVADLLSLELADPASDADGTARALDWLELGADVASDLRATSRHATFDLRSLTAAAAERATGSRPAPGQSQWLLDGSLSLHGVRAPKTSEISVEFGDTSAGPPEELVIRSRKPLIVSLSTHDLRPRDSRGNALSIEPSTREASSAAREARVTFELVFIRTAGG